MKFYIAGKITGDPDYKRKFDEAEKALARIGHSVMNPAKLGSYPEFTWEDYMFITKAMQFKCNAVLLLSDWCDSRGAMMEFNTAHQLNQAIYYDVSDVPPANEGI